MKIERDTDGTPTRITMRRPSDMHQHLRQGSMLQTVVPLVARRFHNIIVMPNTQPPITTCRMAMKYYEDIAGAIDESDGPDLRPMMTLYLTDRLEPAEVERGVERDEIYGVKFYPRGLTTNSDQGVADPSALWTEGTKPFDVLRALDETGGVLLLHAANGVDASGDELDPYDQEKDFFETTLPRIIEAHPGLKISAEHLSTAWGAAFIEEHAPQRPGLLGCSLTAHHLLLDRRDALRGGLRPDRFWWPIIQPAEHREVLRELAKKGHPFVWLGSDSAPHPMNKKRAECCAGGVLMAHAGIELYVEAFEEMDALDQLEQFASVNGPAFFGVSYHEAGTITLERNPWTVQRPFSCATADGMTPVIPFRLGEEVLWRLVD